MAQRDDANRARANFVQDQGRTEHVRHKAASTRFEQLESKVGDFAKAVGEKPPSAQSTAPITAEDIAPKAIARFFARASLNQNLLTHACVLAHQSKKALSILEFCEATDFNAPSSYQGFLNCMNAIQLCSRKAVDGKGRTYSISVIHPELTTQSKSYFLSYIDENYSDNPDEKAKWLEKFKKVEDLFAASADAA